MISISSNKQSGAVSLFVVIFAMLLITIVTVSFLRLMVGDLNQATNNDLSQSAYDSAMAGTEDAKRALIYYERQCAINSTQCAQFESVSDQCNAALRLGGVVGIADENRQGVPAGTTGEIRVQQTSAEGVTFDQAYTCVKIALNTDNVEGEIANGDSKLIPLTSVSAFDSVRISWYSQDDISTPSTPIELDDKTAGTPLPLERQTNWPAMRPPVLQAQLMQFGDSFALSQFDYTSSGQSNTNTAFLYPVRSGGTATSSFMGVDQRATSPTSEPAPDMHSNSPRATTCRPSISSGGYACSMTLSLPTPIGGGDRTAYIHLTPFYKATHFEVRLLNSGAAVQFKGVQPLVDSTGRANDVFRRVQSRVEIGDPTFPYPQAAVDVSSEFCKDFTVIDEAPMITSTCQYTY